MRTVGADKRCLYASSTGVNIFPSPRRLAEGWAVGVKGWKMRRAGRLRMMVTTGRLRMMVTTGRLRIECARWHRQRGLHASSNGVNIFSFPRRLAEGWNAV